MKYKFISFIALAAFSFSCTSDKPAEHITQGVVADSAMVVSAHPLATKVGFDVLSEGGNAVDAAIAVQFALAVVYPAAGNIGGGGFMVYRDKEGNTDALDFREAAPLASTRNMYQNENGEVLKSLSRLGHLAVGVPGTVDGMVEAHKKYGSLPWIDLIQPAIEMARKGFPLTEKEADRLNNAKAKLQEANTLSPDFLLKDWSEGDTLQLKDLALTLERIRNEKRNGFYKGATANLIVAEMQRGNGLITAEDLEEYHATWRKPIEGNYKNYNIISMPPPSSGGIALLQLLKMTESFPIKEHGFHSVETIHFMVECEKRVYADRAAHLGDPDFYVVPVKKLLDQEYINKRANQIKMQKATPSDSIQAGDFSFLSHVSEETTHFSIVDPEGNAVALTTTLNGSFGSHVVVNGAGFLLNNEMDDFSAKPGVPNMYGLVGGEANAIAPLKRMLSSMTPTIVEKEGQLHMVVGTPGGSTIITSVYQTVLNVVEFNMTMQEAINAGRFHHQWKPDSISVEQNALSEETIEDLKEKGHAIKKRGAIGRVDAILVRPNGKLEGGADPRGDDAALGF